MRGQYAAELAIANAAVHNCRASSGVTALFDSQMPGLLLFLFFFLFTRFVTGFDGIGFGHVLALLGPAVIARVLVVIDLGFGIDPNHSGTAPRGGCALRNSFGRGARTGRCRSGRALRFEHVRQCLFRR